MLDSLGYSPKQKGCIYKRDCIRQEDIAEMSAKDLEKAMQMTNKIQQSARIWAAPGSSLVMTRGT